MKSKKQIAKMRLGLNGKPEPSRRGPGVFRAIYQDPRSLLKDSSYLRRLLHVLGKGCAGSEKIKNDFNKRFGKYYKRPKTQGSVSNYLSRLFVWGLVDIDVKSNTWSLMPGLDLHNGKELYEHALARQKQLRKLFGDNQ